MSQILDIVKLLEAFEAFYSITNIGLLCKILNLNVNVTAGMFPGGFTLARLIFTTPIYNIYSFLVHITSFRKASLTYKLCCVIFSGSFLLTAKKAIMGFLVIPLSVLLFLQVNVIFGKQTNSEDFSIVRKQSIEDSFTRRGKFLTCCSQTVDLCRPNCRNTKCKFIFRSSNSLREARTEPG